MHGLTMKTFSVLLSLAPLALAQTDATELPVSEFLSGLYGDSLPTAATGAVATSLASALYSYENALTTDAAYVSAEEALNAVVATLTNSDDIMATLAALGPLNPAFTTQSWYTADVPADVRSELGSVIQGMHAVETSVLNAGAGATASTGVVTVTSTGTTSTGTNTASGANASSTTSPTSSVSHAGAAQITQMAVAGIAAAFAAGAAIAY